jgi:hypothetical protein
MKIIVSYTNPQTDDLWINNLDALDVIVDEGEATEIIVDDFLSSFHEKDLYSVLNRLISKLIKGGRLIVYYTDIELLATRLAQGHVTISDFNDIVFSTCPNLKSFLSTDSMLDLLKILNIKITTKQIKNGYTLVLSGVYQ